MYELKDYLNAINYTKEPLMDTEDEQWERKYPPYIVNKCVAPFQDTIMLVNEINQFHHLDKKLQFDLLNKDSEKAKYEGEAKTKADHQIKRETLKIKEKFRNDYEI